ncbi:MULTISPECIES: hypothetical protein [unclassified Caballeronia]|nr:MULTISPECIES: hypothetical protein [unclassified Caballeronia]
MSALCPVADTRRVTDADGIETDGRAEVASAMVTQASGVIDSG